VIIFGYKYHLLFSTLIFIIIKLYYDYSLGLIAFIACIFAALLPDIDHPNSKISKKLFLISWILNFFLRHRGLTHSFICLGLILFGTTFFHSHEITYGILIGYGSHLLGDMSTTMGVPLFWPKTTMIRIPIIWRFPLITKILWTMVLFYYIVLEIKGYI
jgi:inner membrane protein